MGIRAIFKILILLMLSTATAWSKNTNITASPAISKQALFQAIADNNIALVSRYLTSGGDTRVLNNVGMTPLALAIQTDNRTLVELFIAKGADVTVKDHNGWGLLHLVGSGSMAKLLLDKGVALETIDEQGNNALHTTSSTEVATFLAARGISLYSRNKKGRTPLHVATALGNDQIVQFLLDKQVDVNARDQFGKTALFLAERKKIARLLLDQGADISVRDSRGQTALHTVVDKQVATSLIANGADVNARNFEGQTPLHVLGQTTALFFRETRDVIELLLQEGADIKARDNKARTPLHVVDSVEIAELFLAQNADLDAEDDEGRTPLQSAEQRPNKKMVKLFSEKMGITAEHTRQLSFGESKPELIASDVLTKPTPILRSKSAITLQQKLDEAIAQKLAKAETEAVNYTKMVGPPKPKLLAALRISAQFDVAGEFHKGSAPVRVGDKWGLIDTKGEWILAPTFTHIGRYSDEGLLPVKAGDKYGYINHLGTTVTDFKFDDAKPFSEGLAAVKIGDEWGYILPDGEWYLTPGFEDVGSFKQGIAPVKFEGWGYALRNWSDKPTGKRWLLEPYYQKTFEFSERHGVFQKDNLMGLVDADKNILIKPRYLNMKKYAEGLIPVSKKPGVWFFVDENDKKVIDDTFQAVSSFSEGLVSVKKKGKWGYIDKHNRVIIPFEYDRAYDFNDGVAVVVKGENRLFIDKQGRALSEDFADVYRVSEGYAAVKIDDQWGYVFIPPMSTNDIKEPATKSLVDVN